MKKNWFFLITSLLCIVVSMFAITYAWYIGGNSKVNGELTGFEAVSPEDIAIDIENSQAIEYPFNGTDGLIPCSPIGAGIDAISSDEWFIPSFLPGARGRRCCYAFDITVYSSEGFTGTKRIAVNFEPKATNIADKEKYKVEVENPKREQLGLPPLTPLTTTQVTAKQAASDALVNHIQCAAILLKGNEIGVNQLIAHTDYSIYDEESDYYIKAGRQMDDFYYEFNRHTANVSEADLNQKIRVLVWIDGFVPDYSVIAGGEVMIAISIQDKTPGSSGPNVDPSAAVDAFMDMYNAAKAKFEAEGGIKLTTREEFKAVVDAYNALPDKKLIGQDDADGGVALRKEVANHISDWTNTLRYYSNVLAFMNDYNKVKDSFDANGVTIQNYVSMRTVINNYQELLSEDGQKTILEGGEIEGGAGVADEIAKWTPQLQTFEANLAKVNAFLETHYEPNKDKVVNQQTRDVLQAAVDNYNALTIGQKGLLRSLKPEVPSKINEWSAALVELEQNIQAVNTFKETYYDPIVSDYGTVVIEEVQNNLTTFNTLETEYNKLSTAQKNLLDTAVKTNIQDWLVKIADVNEYNLFITTYRQIAPNDDAPVEITDANRSPIQNLLTGYDIRIASNPQRLGLVSQAIKDQIEAWRTKLRGTRWNINNDTDFKKADGTKATWLTDETALGDKTRSKTIPNKADQDLKEEGGVKITAVANKTFANYKSNLDPNGNKESDLNLSAKKLGLGYMIRAEAYYSDYDISTNTGTVNPNAQDFLRISLPSDFSGTVTITASTFQSPLDANGKPTRFIALKLSDNEGTDITIESPNEGEGHYVVNQPNGTNTETNQYQFKFTVRSGGTYYVSNVDHSGTVSDQKAKSIVYISSISVNSATDNVSDFRKAVEAISTTTVPIDTQSAIDRARTLYGNILEENKPQVAPALETLVSWENAIDAIVAIGNIGEVTKDNYLTKEALVTAARTAYDQIASDTDKAKVYNITALTDAETAIAGYKAEAETAAQASIDAFLAEMAKIDVVGSTRITEDNCDDATLFTAVRELYYAIPEAYRTNADVVKAVNGTYAVKRKLAEDIRNFVAAVDAIGTTITLDSKALIETAEGLYAKFAVADRERVVNTNNTLAGYRTQYNALTVTAFKNAVVELNTYKADLGQWETLISNAVAAYEAIAVADKNTTDVATAKQMLDNFMEVDAFLAIYNSALNNTSKQAEAVQAYDGLNNDASTLFGEADTDNAIANKISEWRAGIQVDASNINVVWTAKDADIKETKDDKGNVTAATAKTWFDDANYVALQENKMAFNAKDSNGSIKTTTNTSDVIISSDYTLTQSGDPVRIVAVGGKTYSDVGFVNRNMNLARFVKSYSAYKAGDASTERALNFIKITIPSGFVGKVAIKAAPYNTPTQADRKRTINLRLSNSNGTYNKVVASTGSTSVEHPFTYEFVAIDTTSATTYTTFYLSNIWDTTNGANANATVFISEIAVVSSAYVPPKHTVTFNSMGGSTVESKEVAVGGTITAPTPPTKDGYTFAGWYKEESLTTAFNFTSETITSDITLYAKWTKNPTTTYKVTFNPKGGTFTGDKEVTVQHGKTVAKPIDPVYEGHTFDGWYDNDKFNGEPFNFNTPITGALKLYAKWTKNPTTTYTVTFDSMGGTIVSAIEVTAGGTISPLPTTERMGYTFNGWFTQANGQGEKLTTTTVINANAAYFAHWQINSYTVTFNTDGGSAIDNQTINHGGKITEPVAPTKDGFTFGGWYKEDTLTTVFDFTADTVTANITLYAKWTAVTPDPAQEVTLWDSANVATNTWYDTADPTTTPVTLAGKNGFVVNTVANKASSDTGHTVELARMVKVGKSTSGAIAISVPAGFNGNIIISAAPYTANKSFSLALSTNQNTTDFTTYSGTDAGVTSTGKGGTHAFEFAVDTTGATSATTYYLSTGSGENVYIAKIAYQGTISGGTVEPITKHTVTINKNDGSANTTQEVADGETFAVPAAPTRAGYTFDGWYTDSGFTTKVTTDTITITSDVVLYAKWTEVITTYTVTFNSNGGSTVESKTVTAGGKVEKPTDPTKTGYTFGGWYKEDTLTTVFDFTADTVTANITLYAKWTAEKYTVTYMDGETVLHTVTDVAYSTKINLYTPSAKDGYTFNGWLLNNTGSLLTANSEYEITSNTTFYGNWTKNKYTVTFNVNGGSAVTAQEVEHGNKATEPADPTKSGYTFGGWFTDTNCTAGNEFDFNTAITANTMLYAKWTASATTTQTVTFNFNTNSTGWTATKTGGNVNPSLKAKSTDASDKYWSMASGGKTTVLLKTTASYTNITSISVEVAEFSNNKDVVFTLYVVGADGTPSAALATVTESATGTAWSPQTLTYSGLSLTGNILIEAFTPSGRTIAIDNVVITYAA